MVKKLLLIFSVFWSVALSGAHLVGGEITYRCLGNNNYEITLIIYRDCFTVTGAPFDPQAVITIYDANNNRIKNLKPSILSTSKLPLNAPSNCSKLPNSVCTEKAIYKVTTSLPPLAGGYVITHQRCCRNNTITNIPNPGNWGATYTTHIPDNFPCNSSPSFNDTPPVVLCLNRDLNLDMSATDIDGDSLYYELCTMLHGGGRSQNGTSYNSPAPDPAAPPNYTTVPFNINFSSSYPITSNPIISIDPQTGRLTGKPTQLGQFVFGICVNEYRNGQFVNKIRRDFQFNVTDKCNATISDMEDQIMNPATLCSGRTIKFKSISDNATSVLWDFGDPTTTLDVSNLAEPTYTYADTGVYTVRLIANPGNPCADTSYVDFRVFYPVDVVFDYTGSLCYEDNALNFSTYGDYSPFASFEWDFGGMTNIGSNTTIPQPDNITFLTPGTYYVKVTVEDFECVDTYGDSLFIFPYPVLKHYCPRVATCAPAKINFHDSSRVFGLMEHTWDFGDGQISREASPTHIYEEEGTYTVIHKVRTLQGCLDTLEETFENHIEIHPQPIAELKVTPSTTSIYEPQVEIWNQNNTHSKTETYLPDGELIENLDSTSITLTDTGEYDITHIVYNNYGCTDTLVKTIYIEAPLNFFIPSAFTPNGDGVNDIFSMSITGINDYYIRIFNRWGQMVFESASMDIAWNGNIFNGFTQASAGLYTYQVIVETEKNARNITRHGTVTLLR